MTSLRSVFTRSSLGVQGSGFNWPAPDHFRLVFLPYEDDLRDAIARIARFLAAYRQRAGT